MKKLLIAVGLMIGATTFFACNDSNDEPDSYEKWKQQNADYLDNCIGKKTDDGKGYYEVVIPQWDPNTFVLMHWFNDRKETEGNLSPLYTSTIDVRYQVHFCTGAGLDSSDYKTEYGPGVARFPVNGLIKGWAVATANMRVGDSCEVIVPYQLAYGEQGQTGSSGGIAPYSNLRFNIRLVDIPYYELPNPED